MSKILLAILISALPSANFGHLKGLPELPASTQKRAFNAKGEITVEVTFDGIMVFRRVGDHYEVGILDEATAKGHQFSVFRGRTEIPRKELKQFLGKGNIWHLEIVTPSGRNNPSIWERRSQDCDRLRDTVAREDRNHAYDFCWIMDLENDFHNQPLELIPGKLKPIIWLNNGELYTKLKYDQLQRKQSYTPSCSDYGFAAETIALKIQLQKGEKLVLRVDGTKDNVFELPRDGVSASIFNAPPKKEYMDKHNTSASACYFEPSHFSFYYQLFRNIPADSQYNIKPKRNGFRPLNRFRPSRRSDKFNEVRKDTFDNQACGAILLGRSTTSLH